MKDEGSLRGMKKKDVAATGEPDVASVVNTGKNLRVLT